ncbi:MAG: K(+)-transporting ATPase subunit F [Xanthomonadaceae bacterium]|nr:K(+)-transporting ATPase subunit F [Dyella thiooxydans]MBU6249016.1 K(+)-transporting ATPase subunit F [Xanthomonadaceae bacterium]MDE1965104.1 K(+)-transporting ATPase subunit F [Xanthomonadaceae bacterium]
MTAFYILAAVLAVAVTGYLCVALLKPEWFE